MSSLAFVLPIINKSFPLQVLLIAQMEHKEGRYNELVILLILDSQNTAQHKRYSGKWHLSLDNRSWL